MAEAKKKVGDPKKSTKTNAPKKNTPKKTSTKSVVTKKAEKVKPPKKEKKVSVTKTTKKTTKAKEKVSANKTALTSKKTSPTTTKAKAEKKAVPPKANKKKATTVNVKSPFDINEYIFYPNEGLGHIIGIEKIELEGAIIPYYVIKFPAQKMINKVPVKNAKKVGIRKIVSKNVAKNVLKRFEQDILKNEMSWKDRLLMYQEINTKGNMEEMADMLAALFARKQQKTSLSFQERQVFDYTLESISNEIAVVLEMTNQEAVNEIVTRLTSSYKRTEDSLT